MSATGTHYLDGGMKARYYKTDEKSSKYFALAFAGLSFSGRIFLNGKYYQFILLALLFDITLGFCMGFIKSFWGAFALSVFGVVALLAVVVLASMADARKDSLDWQIGAAIGMGFFISALCLFGFSLSFPLYKHFQDRPDLTRRLKLLGKLCIGLPLLAIPLFILLAYQQFYHLPTGILPEALTAITGGSILGSLVPAGYLMLFGKRLKGNHPK
jgi:NADH:ubiquinone oxidoreductase subunit 3 (subunit A)